MEEDADNTWARFIIPATEKLIYMYQMSVEDFEKIPANSAKEYYLTTDIDFNKATSPLSTVNFAGTLDGRGYAIKNLTGQLFNNINNATIKNTIGICGIYL